MMDAKSAAAVHGIVEILRPFTADERAKILGLCMMLTTPEIVLEGLRKQAPEDPA